MGYIVNAFGYIVMKNKEDVPAVENIMADSLDFDLNSSNIMTIEVSYYGRYDDNAFSEIIASASPFVKEGKIEFSGEDNEYWKYEFINGEWEEDSGEIIYDKEPVFIVLQEDMTANTYHSLGVAQRAKERLEKKGVTANIIRSVYHM